MLVVDSELGSIVAPVEDRLTPTGGACLNSSGEVIHAEHRSDSVYP